MDSRAFIEVVRKPRLMPYHGAWKCVGLSIDGDINSALGTSPADAYMRFQSMSSGRGFWAQFWRGRRG